MPYIDKLIGSENNENKSNSLLRNMLFKEEQRQKEVEDKVASETIRTTDEEAQLIKKITENVADKHRDDIAISGFTDNTKKEIQKTIKEVAEAEGLDYEQQKRIERVANVNIIGLGPIEMYMSDPSVSEIIVQRYNNICIERGGLIEFVDASFINEEQLLNVINRIVQPINRQINLLHPTVAARLPDGSRIHATIPPASPDGATLNIRKFFPPNLTGEDYLRFGGLSIDMLDFLADSAKAKINIIVSGGTGVGKTTLLNVISGYIPENELIITIEDSCELQLGGRNVRRLEAKTTTNENGANITIQELVKNALRMRPDRIIVGEIRDGTVVDMITAMSTGHEGSLSTVHANSPAILVNSRLPILYSMNRDVSFSEESINMQIESALDLIVHIAKVNGKRIITHITHVNGLDEKGRVKLNDIFLYDKENQAFKATGYIPKNIIRKAKQCGIEINESIFQKTIEKVSK